MELDEVLEIMGYAGVREEAVRLRAGLPAEAPDDWRTLAAALALRVRDRETRVFGISGGQGAGKTTLARVTVAALEALGRRAVSLSLDDFYLTRGERHDLAAEVHPLLATRGVPGTHDVSLAVRVVGDLLGTGAAEVPRFDKGADDRCAATERIEGVCDVVVLEGWCLGVPAQPPVALVEPCNALEAREDPHGAWRGYVNRQLDSAYPALWAMLEDLLYLQVPGIDAVLRWRTLQESALPAADRMTADALGRFVSHYERLTRWMSESLAATAPLVARLDEFHRLAALERHG